MFYGEINIIISEINILIKEAESLLMKKTISRNEKTSYKKSAFHYITILLKEILILP
jgi:hypothetical protein